jgi:hypothetical protein
MTPKILAFAGSTREKSLNKKLVRIRIAVVAIPLATEAFADDGSLKDAKNQASVEGLGRKLAEFLHKLYG